MVILMVTKWSLNGENGGFMECIGDFNGDFNGENIMNIWKHMGKWWLNGMYW